jgi:hypothetical protein
MRSHRRGGLNSCALAIAAAIAATLVASSAHAATVKEIFEKYRLIGTFAWDCTKPASADHNWYHVHRLLDTDHLQRDFMTGPTTRQWVVIIDQAAEAKPSEITASGKVTGRIAGRDLDNKPTSGVWHVEPGRILQVEATVDGQKAIANGKLTASGFQIPWSNRCGD